MIRHYPIDDAIVEAVRTTRSQCGCGPNARCVARDGGCEGPLVSLGMPIANEVHRNNMTKIGGPLDPITGKKLKPPGWVPPDIEGELRRQGWKP